MKQHVLSLFYHRLASGRFAGSIKGWPMCIGSWCKKLKYGKVNILKYILETPTVQLPNEMNLKSDIFNIGVQYLGIAADEPVRLTRLDGISLVSPLAAAGWTETDCLKWCKDNKLLSPIYETETRGGCWFCHMQPLDSLRRLYNNYPELWRLMLKWDADSPVSYKSDGHTVHDYDKRFKLEDAKLVPKDQRFRWRMIESEE